MEMRKDSHRKSHRMMLDGGIFFGVAEKLGNTFWHRKMAKNPVSNN
jgi:hypothetical protein